MENFRITIITNFHDDTDSGILKVLDDTESEFVEEYMYYPSLKPKITQEKPFLYLSKNEVSYEEFKGWQVLFISDNLTNKDMYPNSVFNSDTLVMFHSSPGNIQDILEDKAPETKKKGAHEPDNDENGYPLINNIIKAYSDKKFDAEKYDKAIEKIINWFGVGKKYDELEAKLDLLHNCLCPESVPEELFPLLAKYEKYKNSFEKFNAESFEKNWDEKEYIIALADLRNSLLDS